MAFTRVQGGKNHGDLVASLGATISAVGSGNSICGCVTFDNSGPTSLNSVTDNQGNTYNLETQQVDTGNSQPLVAFSRTNITNAPTVITANFSNALAGSICILVDEFSGGSTASADERDGSAHGGQFQSSPGTGTDAVTSGTFTTATNGDLLWGGSGSALGAFATEGTSFTQGTQEIGTFNNTIQSEYRTQATAGSGTAATFTQAANNPRVTFLIAIKPAAGGSAPPNGWWRDESERLTMAPLRFDTRGPAFVSTFRTAAIAGTAWHRNFPEANPKPPVCFQPPSAFVSTFRTAVISGIAWSRDETESKPWSPRRFEVPPAWDPQPIAVVATAPPNGWLTTSADQPRRRPPIDQPVMVQFTPPQTAGWPQLAQDRLWPRFRLSDAALAWNPANPTPQTFGWWMLAQDRLPLRVRLLLDVPAINLTPPTTPSTIDGIAWFEPFDRLPRIPVPAPRDAAPAFGFPIVDTSAGVTGMAWFEPWDRDKRSVRVTIEASPAISLTPDTLPVGIFGMSWFAPPDRDRPRFTPTVETFPAWGPQFVVQVAPPPSTGGDDFLVLARRRGRR